MPQGVTIAAMLLSLAAPAAAQLGARVTLPPHSRQSGKFHFANSCGTTQTYKAVADPPASWLHFEPATVDVLPGNSSEVRVGVDAGNQALGSYRSALKVYCASCAASDPPCFQNALQFSLEMTVASVPVPSEFVAIAPPPREELRPSTARSDEDGTRPAPFVPAEPARRRPSGLVPVVGAAALAVGALGLVLSLRALWPKREMQPVDGESAVESKRHRVQR